MLRFQFKLVLIFALTLSVISFAARAFGNSRPLSPLFEGFKTGCEGQPQPCWQGILIGKVSVEEAINRLHQLDYTVFVDDPGFMALKNTKTPICQINLYYSSDDIVSTMGWGACQNVRCGDFYAYLSQRNRAVLEGSCVDPRNHEKSPTKLLFADLLTIRALSCGYAGLPSCKPT